MNDVIDDFRREVRAVTGETWSKDRVATLLSFMPPSEAIEAVRRARRLRQALERAFNAKARP